MCALVTGVQTCALPICKGVDADGNNLSLLPTSIDISWFPLENPGIVSIPLGFLLGFIGSITSKENSAAERYTELEVRALRSEEHRVGKECVSTCQYRWSPYI